MKQRHSNPGLKTSRYSGGDKRDGSRGQGGQRIRCNICSSVFRAATPFQRFCRSCKDGDELFKFSEWMAAGTA